MRYFLLIGLTATILAGCSQHSSDPIKNGSDKTWLVEVLTWVDMDDVVSAYDTSDVNAIVMLSQDYNEIRDWANGTNLTAYTEHQARAFYNPVIPGTSTLADISVNSTSLDIGGQGFTAGLNSTGFNSNFSTGSTTNSIYKSSDSYLGSINTSSTFADRVRFTGLSVTDTVDISSGKMFYFAGSSIGYMQISLFCEVPNNPVDTNNPQVITKIFPAASSVTLSGSDLANMVAGKGEIEVIKWDPKFVTTSNGKKIAFVGRTSHRIAVYIVP